MEIKTPTDYYLTTSAPLFFSHLFKQSKNDICYFLLTLGNAIICTRCDLSRCY